MTEYKYIIVGVGIIIVSLLWYRRESIKNSIKEGIYKELKRNGVVSKIFLQDTFNDEYAFEYIEDQIRKKEIIKLEVDDGEQLYLLNSDFVHKQSKLINEKYIDINVLIKYWKMNRINCYASVMEECKKHSGGSLIKISDESDTIFYVNEEGLNNIKDGFSNKTVVRIDDFKSVIGEQPTGIVLNTVKEALKNEYEDWYLYYQKGNKIAWFNRVIIEKVKGVQDDIIDVDVMKSVFQGIVEDELNLIIQRVFKIIRDVTGEEKYELIEDERNGRIWIKKEIVKEILDFAGKEIVTMEDISQVVKNDKYNHVMMDYMVEHYGKMKGFIFFPEYDVWIEGAYISKYKCEKCEKVFLRLKTYGPKSYCERCLEQIHRQEDEDEKKGKTVKRYVAAPPPGIKIKT